jgi:hypothetical protein
MTDLRLDDIPRKDRWRVLAALGGGRKARSPEYEVRKAAEQQEWAEDCAQLRARYPRDEDYEKAMRDLKRIRDNLKFLRKCAERYWREEAEAALAARFDHYARTDTPLRNIVRETGLNREHCKYRLRIARDDLDRAARGEPTTRQLAAKERAEQWRKLRESVDAARAARRGH